MEFKDLEKKLENIKTPSIEIQSHKQRLKMALLNSGCFKEEKIMNPIMFWTKRLVPAGAVLALILVIGFFSVINPKLQIARATEIAENDPQIRELMEEYGAEIKEVELENDKAYVSFRFPEVNFVNAEELPVLSAEVDLRKEEIRKFRVQTTEVITIPELAEEEKAGAIEIIKNTPEVWEMVADLEVKEVRPLISVRSHPDSGKLTIDPPVNDRVIATFGEPGRRIGGIMVQVTVDLTTGQVEKAVKALLGEGVIEKYPLDL